MYPKVFVGFANAQRRYGPVAKLPTLTYFYGMAPGHEIGVEIEQGKTLVIRLTAIGETEEDGTVRLFFELNGQTRVIVVPDRSAAATATVRRTADPNNEGHIAAPMPGLVASVAVQQGQLVKAGDLIMTLEAMKMETGILAPRDAMIAEMVVHAGQTIDAKDLLVVLQ
jgi:pyruvate carboxylase